VDIGWFPRRQLFDILTLLIGSVLIASIAMLLAAPVGLAVAVYLAECASIRTRDIVKPILEILAGIPSVVLGFWALTFLNPKVVQPLFHKAGVFNILVAGIAVGILVIPLVASVSEDAMRAVPRSLREASYGLGARRVTTVVRVVIPAAVSGIAAAMILAISRAVGETMIVAIAAGGTGGSLRTFDILGQGQTITAAMAALATGSDQVQGGQAAYLSLFFLGLVLFLLTLMLNLAGDIFVRRTRMHY
jgi:phosphate transport system permease protein